MTNDETRQTPLEDLLPWYAAGTLEPGEAKRVEAAMRNDPKLARSLELVQEERGATIELNESLGAPSPHAMSRLVERIGKEAPRPIRPAPVMERVAAWIADRLLQAQPRALAWSAVAAALVIAVQAGLLGYLTIGRESATYETASGPTEPMADRPSILVGFNEQATAAQIAALLESRRATIIEGPRAGGIYRVALPAGSSAEDVQRTVEAWRRDAGVVRFAAPGR